MGLLVQLVKHDRTGELYIVLREEALDSPAPSADEGDVSPQRWRPCVITLKRGRGWTRGERFTVLRNVHFNGTDD